MSISKKSGGNSVYQTPESTEKNEAARYLLLLRAKDSKLSNFSFDTSSLPIIVITRLMNVKSRGLKQFFLSVVSFLLPWCKEYFERANIVLSNFRKERETFIRGL